MRKLLSAIFITVLLAGCATVQQYYLKTNLNNISIGQSKQSLLNLFPGQPRVGGAPPMQIRAAQKNDSSLIEVGEVLMTDGVSATVAYWFLFEDGVLVQWGQPSDWKAVKARYEISYSPSVSPRY